MSIASFENELARLQNLRSYSILDTAAEKEFDDITQLAALICEVPIALISLVDSGRQWFKSKIGFDASETARDAAFCAYAIQQPNLFIVNNALKDKRFARRPLVIGEPYMRFYAGAPLITPEGYILGTLCVIDTVPRELQPEQQNALAVLARQVVTMITLRRQSEWLVRANQSLKENEEKYRIVTDSASDVILTVDENSTILFANPAVEKIFGYAASELINVPLEILMPERFREVHSKSFQRYLQTGEKGIPWNGIEVSGLHRDGHEIQIEISFGQYQQSNKRTFTAVIRDITTRKLVEAQLRASEEKYRFLAETVPQQVWTAEPDGQIEYVNQRAFEYFGKENGDDSLFGDCWIDALHPEDSAQCFELWEKSLKAGQPFEAEFRLRRFDGGYRWHLSQAIPMFDGDNQIIRWFGTNTDIHDHKSAEEANRKSEEYRNLFRHANDAILIFDPHSEIVLDASDKACEIYGFTRDEFIGLSLKDLSQNVQHGEKQLEQLLVQGACQAFETVQFRRDGTPINLMINSSVIEYQGRTAILSINRDITERKRAEEALYESQQMLQLVMDNIPQSVFWKDRNSVFLGCNRLHAQIIGLNDPSEIIGKTDYDFTYKKEEAVFFRECDQRVINTGVPEHNIVEPLHKPDGSLAWLETSKVPFRDVQGNIVGVLGTFGDITDRRRADAALRESEYKLRTLLQSMSEGLLQVDNNETIEFVNDRFCEMFGYEREELLGKVASDLFCDEDGRNFVREANWQRLKEASGQYEISLKKKNKDLIWVLIGGAPVINSENVVTGTMGVFTNITERKRAEEQLLHDAFHDALTGLANRSLFMYHLQLTLDQSKRSPEKLFAVLFLDFDRFKIINDSLGHAIGDKLLISAARRLEAVLRPGDLIARLGGDEFTILLSEFEDQNDALHVAERIHEELKNPFNINGHEISTSVSIGIALSSSEHEKAEDMLRGADIAMYRAKTKGPARYQVFDRSMHKQALTRLQLETEMPRAFDQQEFCLYYQPIINLHNSEIVGFESLIRWQHPTRGLIPPTEFIPMAEESGFILSLGQWILRESCRQLRQWQATNLLSDRLTISVNLSGKQFLQFDLAERIDTILKETSLPPHCLRLEITESHLMENTEMAVTTLNKLRSLGLELSLDDFGTGYSSLSYLHRLPVSHLKIDQSFVHQMIKSTENSEIVQTIVKLAHNLKMSVVAEGIETAEQLAYLKKLNCDFGQGFLYSYPLDAICAAEIMHKPLTTIAQISDQQFVSAN